MKLLAVILSVFVAATAAYGQAGAGYNGLSFTSPLELSVGTDRNFLIDRLSPEQRLFFLSFAPTIQRETGLGQPLEHDDQVVLLTAPTVSFISDSRRRQLSFSYRPEFEMFLHNSDQNSLNHDGNVAFSYWMGRRWNLTVRDQYRSSNDPARTTQNVFLLLPRSSYSENAFRTELAFDASALTRVAVRYDNTRVKFGDIDPFQVRMLDTVSDTGSIVVSRMLNQRSRVRGSYAVTNVTPIEETGIADEGVDTGHDRPLQHFFTGDYRVAINPGLVMEFLGGVAKGEVGTDYLFRVFGTKRLGNMWVGGGYSRTAAFFVGDTRAVSNTLRSTDMYEVFSFQLRGEPFRRVGVQTFVTASRSVSDVIVEGSRSLMGRFRLDYRLSDRVATFFNAETYQQNRNLYVAAPLSRNRFFVEIQYSFTSEEERRVNRLNRDAENVSIDERDRRSRTNPQ